MLSRSQISNQLWHSSTSLEAAGQLSRVTGQTSFLLCYPNASQLKLRYDTCYSFYITPWACVPSSQDDEGYIVGAEYGGCPTLIISTDTPFFDLS